MLPDISKNAALMNSGKNRDRNKEDMSLSLNCIVCVLYFRRFVFQLFKKEFTGETMNLALANYSDMLKMPWLHFIGSIQKCPGVHVFSPHSQPSGLIHSQPRPETHV